MHKPNCPALDPFAHLLGDCGRCDCGGDDTGVLRLPEKYTVETCCSGFEQCASFPTYDTARAFAESERDDIGGDIHIWVQRADVVQLPESPRPLDYLEHVS